jgi:hypothetical protein
MQALEVAAQVIIGHILQHWHFFARALETGVAATEEFEANIQEEFVKDTADLIDSLDRMAPGLLRRPARPLTAWPACARSCMPPLGPA